MSFWADYERASRAAIAARKPRTQACRVCGDPIPPGRAKRCRSCIVDNAEGLARAARGRAWRIRQKQARRTED